MATAETAVAEFFAADLSCLDLAKRRAGGPPSLAQSDCSTYQQESSLARNTAVGATSCGWPNLAIGSWASLRAAHS